MSFRVLRESRPVYRLGTISVPQTRALEVDAALAFLQEKTGNSVSAAVVEAILAYARSLGWEGHKAQDDLAR